MDKTPCGIYSYSVLLEHAFFCSFQAVKDKALGVLRMFPLAIMLIEDDSDRAFMEQLYLAHHENMFKRALQLTHSKEDAEDIVDEAIIRLIKNIPTLRSKSSFVLKKYIVVVVERIVIDRFRKKKAQPVSEVLLPTYDEMVAQVSSSDNTPEEEYIEVSELNDLTSVLSLLPSNQGRLLELKYVLGYGNREIAQILKLQDENSVRAYLSKARANAKALLRERRPNGYARA